MSSISTSELDQRIHSALDAAKMALWEFDLADGMVNWTGKITSHFYEFSKNFDGQLSSYLGLVHHDDQAEVMDLIAGASQGQSFVNQHRLKFPDGTYHWVEGIGNVVVGEGGIKLTGTVQDITEKKEIELESADWKQKHELVADSAGIVIYDYDVSTGQLQWSGPLLEIFGYGSSEIDHISKWEVMVHPVDREETIKLLEDAMEKIGPFEVTYRFKTRTGEYKYFLDKGIFLGNGMAERMLGMMQDISYLKHAEIALQESEKRFRSMIQNLNIGVGLYDVNTAPLGCNKMAHELLGMTEEQFMGKAALDLGWQVVRDDGTPFDNHDFPIPRAIREKKAIREVIMGVFRPSKNDWVWLMVDADPTLDDSGTLIHVICTYFDVTALRHVQSRLTEKNEQLTALSTELRSRNERLLEFAQIVSHNLRSPISSISALINIYKSSDEKSKEKAINHIEQVSSKALATITDLNNILKIQQETVKSSTVDIQKILNETLETHSGLMQEAGAELISDLDESQMNYPEVYLDSIFMNLLSNSLKYRSKDRSCRILVKTFREHDDLILTWEDNGVGIDLALHGNDMFQMGKTFHQNEDARGVGLFLIRNQISAMGGGISVESEPGKFTRFKINFQKNRPKDG